MAGTKEGVELPDIGVLRQLCRAELSARLDSVSRIISCLLRFLWPMIIQFYLILILIRVYQCHAHYCHAH